MTVTSIEVQLPAALGARVEPSVLQHALADALPGLVDPVWSVTVVPRSDARLQVVVDGRTYTPSTSSWFRASAAALGRFPRSEESGALLDGDVEPAVLIRGLTEVCLEVLRALRPDVADVGPVLVLGLTPEDFVALHDLDAELARLMWESTGVPLSVHFDVDPAYRANEVSVTLAGVPECPIPLLDPEIERSWISLLDLCRERVARLAGKRTLEAIHELAEQHCAAGFALAIERLGMAALDRVLAQLLRADTPIHDLATVFRAIVELEPPTQDPPDLEALLVRHVRTRLGARITSLFIRGDELTAYVLDDTWSDAWRAAADRKSLEQHLHAALRELDATAPWGSVLRIPLLTAGDLRSTVAELARREFPRIYVISRDEVPPWVPVRLLSSRT